MPASPDPHRRPHHTARHRLVDGWRFGRHVEGSTDPAYDDRGLAPVSVPHCVTRLSWRDWEPSTWEGLWTYRRGFDLPPGVEAGTDRVYVDFEGVLSRATVWINGRQLPEHTGGYLPFTFEITDDVRPAGNVLAVTVDARWLPVPPGGHADGAGTVDYFQPGGIYRDVALRVEPAAYVADVFARPHDVLDDARRRVEVTCTLDPPEPPAGSRLEVEIRDGDRVLGAASAPVSPSTAVTEDASASGGGVHRLVVDGLESARLWDVDDPHLHEVRTRLVTDDGDTARVLHERSDRIGLREARFTPEGFFLNGRRRQLFGINRHQLYPYTGMAMPDRVQRADAELLRNELNITMVRCAHYPQSPAFLDACDELGLLVFEEIPGWQYVGDRVWQERAIDDVEAMVLRDRNRPSIVCWGVQINESAPQPELYRRAKAVADALDGDRATTGAMLASYHSTEDFAQDVFSYNDYAHTGPPEDSVLTLRPPLPDIPYLVTEAVGSLAGPHFYRRTDPGWTLTRQAFLHASAHEQAYADERHSGLLSWQAFDYQSMHGWVDHRVKCNGVGDAFRIPKPGAAIYRAQVAPDRRIVVEPAFSWDFGPSGDGDGPGAEAMICANCDRLEVHVGERHVATATPDRERFGHLPAPPSFVDLTLTDEERTAPPELRIDGYVGDRLAVTRRFSADRAQDRLSLTLDDDRLRADGADMTRAVVQIVDVHGNWRPAAGTSVAFAVDGPLDIVGDDPFPLGEAGGAGAVWLRTRAGQTGSVGLSATDPAYGEAMAKKLTVEPS